jgi:TnpA family transposase
VPVEFLTDEQAAGYATFRGAPSRSELERCFFLDDADRELVESKRRAHARGRIDLVRIERQWEDIQRIIGSIHAGAVRAYDVIRMLSRDGRPTPLGDAIAHYGRIAKSLHILRLADEPGYRRQIEAQANLQEGRHALVRKVFHGRYGQLYQRYLDGMEDQLGALGFVLNALVLFTTRYLDAALDKLRADGFEVRDEDVARLSPFTRHHINMLGRYSFQLPDSPGRMRQLPDPDAGEW